MSYFLVFFKNISSPYPFSFHFQFFFFMYIPHFLREKKIRQNYQSSFLLSRKHSSLYPTITFILQNQKLQLPSFFYLSLFFHLHIYIYTHTYIYIYTYDTYTYIHTYIHSPSTLYNLLILPFPFSLSSNFLTSLSLKSYNIFSIRSSTDQRRNNLKKIRSF